VELRLRLGVKKEGPEAKMENNGSGAFCTVWSRHVCTSAYEHKSISVLENAYLRPGVQPFCGPLPSPLRDAGGTRGLSQGTDQAHFLHHGEMPDVLGEENRQVWRVCLGSTDDN
jgi:hypothetical protein